MGIRIKVGSDKELTEFGRMAEGYCEVRGIDYKLRGQI